MAGKKKMDGSSTHEAIVGDVEWVECDDMFLRAVVRFSYVRSPLEGAGSWPSQAEGVKWSFVEKEGLDVKSRIEVVVHDGAARIVGVTGRRNANVEQPPDTRVVQDADGVSHLESTDGTYERVWATVNAGCDYITALATALDLRPVVVRRLVKAQPSVLRGARPQRDSVMRCMRPHEGGTLWCRWDRAMRILRHLGVVPLLSREPSPCSDREASVAKPPGSFRSEATGNPARRSRSV